MFDADGKRLCSFEELRAKCARDLAALALIEAQEREARRKSKRLREVKDKDRQFWPEDREADPFYDGQEVGLTAKSESRRVLKALSEPVPDYVCEMDIVLDTIRAAEERGYQRGKAEDHLTIGLVMECRQDALDENKRLRGLLNMPLSPEQVVLRSQSQHGFLSSYTDNETCIQRDTCVCGQVFQCDMFEVNEALNDHVRQSWIEQYEAVAEHNEQCAQVAEQSCDFDYMQIALEIRALLKPAVREDSRCI